MTTLQTMIQDLCTAGANPQATIQTSLKETGKPAVGCFPLFVPEELVYAAGFLPVGMWGGISAFQKSNQYIQSFACSIMRANLELGMSGAYDFLKAALIPSQCDTLKCVCENFKVAVPKVPVIGVTIPQNRTIQAAHGQLLDEFDYLAQALAKVQTPDCQPIPLEEAFAIYEDYRAAMMAFLDAVPDYLNTITPKVRHLILKAAWFMDKKVYTEKIRALTAALQAQPKEVFSGKKFLVTGIMLDSLPVLDLLEELADTISKTALCGLGQSACKPVQSTLKYFRDEYLAHVVDHHCPICNKEKPHPTIDPEKCKGCGKCRKNCPMEAITGAAKQVHVIDPEKCINCGACVTNCPFGAIAASK